MMDKYQELRDAIDTGPTPNEWVNLNGEIFSSISHAVVSHSGSALILADVDANYIAAANPETIAALLTERDELRHSLKWCAGAVAAVVPDVDKITMGNVTRTVGGILDEADAALAQVK